MRFRDLPGYLRDRGLGMFPHRAPTGLVAIGNPGADSLVLLTGNFTLTVRRMKQVLAGQDVWLLVADSKGINVWCAAGGGHLTHHDVIAAIRISGIEERVDHRELVLPQLCATGVERHKVSAATGWKARWGPARLEDLPAFLARGSRVKVSERRMRFPLWERLEMAALWAVPMAVLGAPLLAWAGGWTGLAAGDLTVLAMVTALFALLPWLPVQGRIRWLTFLLFAAGGFALGAGLLAALSAVSFRHFVVAAAAAVLGMGILSIDLAGTTPWYGSYINTFHNAAHVELTADRCNRSTDCVQVCPSGVLHMSSQLKRVVIAEPGQCIQCGACIVQCPEDALRFRYDDGSVVEAATLRRTRMNMVGRRTVHVAE